eukprot:352129-Chlamydomonas_euryale.AAC.13
MMGMARVLMNCLPAQGRWQDGPGQRGDEHESQPSPTRRGEGVPIPIPAPILYPRTGHRFPAHRGGGD